MGYTYNDFVSAANSAGLMDKFSPEDIETTRKNPEYGLSMLGFMRDAQNATTAEQRTLAEAAADQLRKTYKTASSSGSMPQFTYDNESQYKQLLEKVSNPAQFSYDAQQDDVYKAARSAYLREGERASTNALVRASAATGGVPSSYAVTVATQAGDYYAGQVADLIPTLEQNAYQRYLSGLDADRAALSVVEGDRSTAYSRFLDQLNLQRQQEQDALTKQQLEQEQAQQKISNAMAMYQLLGYATPEIAATLGIPESAPSAVTGTVGNITSTPVAVDNGTLTNDEVLALQNWMNGKGAGIAADGAWGSQSQGAAKKLGFNNIDDAWAAYQKELSGPGIGGIPAEALQQIKDVSSNGVLPAYLWNQFAAMYGEDALRAAGFSNGSGVGTGSGGMSLGRQVRGQNTQVRM